MNVIDALFRRHCTRAFLERPVERSDIEKILAASCRSPSGANTQPWEVAVMRGGALTRLLRKIESAFREGQPSAMGYNYYPTQWEEPYRRRRVECGYLLYGALGIARDDRERRREQWIANYRAFGAPCVIFVLMRRGLESGSFMDAGMFLQSVMLAACELGLATCPQAALGEYPDLVREALGFDDGYLVLCGLAIGYEDTSAPVNAYRTPREAVHDFARFID
jgi:nitroreductase